MKTRDGFQQCYNAQVAVAEGCQLIVAAEAVDAPTDTQQLQSLVEQVIQHVGVPEGVPADSGYFSEANVQALEQRAAMAVTGHKTRSVFDRYHIVSPGDLQDVARRLSGTLSGTSRPRQIDSRPTSR